MHCVLQNTLRVESDNSVKLQHFAGKIANHNTGVDKGGGRGAQPPQLPGRKDFLVKIEGLLESVVLSLRVRSNAMFTSERRY